MRVVPPTCTDNPRRYISVERYRTKLRRGDDCGQGTCMSEAPGAKLRRAVDEERPLQVVGAINAFCALLAERAGFRAIYLSGAGVANADFGLPDLGITAAADVAENVRRITGSTR